MALGCWQVAWFSVFFGEVEGNWGQRWKSEQGVNISKTWILRFLDQSWLHGQLLEQTS